MLHLAPDTPAGGTRVLHPRSVEVLNAHFATRPAEELLDYALSGALGRIALVSSFGAESAVLLHLAARVDAATPVLFLDTEMLFPETLAYQRALAARLGLTNIHHIRPGPDAADLHRSGPDACCAARKSAPLEQALDGFDGWITGRKRFQSGTRATLPLVEPDAGRIKLNPLADWQRDRIADYFDTHALPRHPLVARGYPSIGCAPCTTPVNPGEAPRAGRWRGQARTECGIHFVNGRAERTPT